MGLTSHCNLSYLNIECELHLKLTSGLHTHVHSWAATNRCKYTHLYTCNQHVHLTLTDFSPREVGVKANVAVKGVTICPLTLPSWLLLICYFPLSPLTCMSTVGCVVKRTLLTTRMWRSHSHKWSAPLPSICFLLLTERGELHLGHGDIPCSASLGEKN